MSGELEASVEWRGAETFQATGGAGFSLTLDPSAEPYARTGLVRPMELLLSALGSCTGMSVMSILSRMLQDVTAYQVNVRGVQREAHPRVFTRIELEHVVRGRNLSIDKVARAIELGTSRYCPIAAMLGETAEIQESHRILDELTGAELARS